MKVDLVDPTEKIMSKDATKKDIADALVRVQKEITRVAEAMPEGVQLEQLARAAEDVAKIKEKAVEMEKEQLRLKEIVEIQNRTVPGFNAEKFERAIKSFPRGLVKPDPLIPQEQRGSRAMYDFLITPEPLLRLSLPDEVVEATMKSRRLFDHITMTHELMLAQTGGRAQRYMDDGGIKSQRLWPAFEALAGPFARAMDTATTKEGLEWVPTGYTSTLIEDIRQELVTIGMFQSVNMPTNPYKFPVQGLPISSFLIPEATGDAPGQAITLVQQTVQSINMIFNAVKHGVMVLTSTELEEDSMVDIVAQIRAESVFAMAFGLENAAWNAQKTAIVDTALNLAGNSTDVRNSWDGIRYAANVIATLTRLNLNGGVAAESLTQIKGSMNRFGIKPKDGLWGTGYLMFAKLLTLKDTNGFAVVLTQDKAGAAATFGTGTLGSMFGSPIVVSETYPQNLDASGLITNANGNLTAIHYVNTRGAKVGIRRAVLVEASRDYLFGMDQIAFRSTGRFDFRWIVDPSKWAAAPLGGYRFVGSGVNMATT